MNSHRAHVEAKQRTVERRQREDHAPRLSAQVPRLAALRFEIENGDSKYTWPIIVERAPALFDIACTEHACRDGGHNLTWDIMAALRASAPLLKGEDVCHGQVGSGTCGRILRYVAVATYGGPISV
jgi:hypothetical protein